MNDTTSGDITLDAAEEAGRLWAAAEAAIGDDDIVRLCEAVEFGLRAVEILAVERLQAVRGDVPATVTLLLERPVADVDIHRDAVSVPATISFTEIVDVLSADDLECVGPHLHRGWEDRRFACQRVRKTSREAAGVTIESSQREDLLLLSAYRNRIFRYPPPVTIQPDAMRAAFTSLREVHDGLVSAD